ncbi:MAG: DNA polymerase/3'-5' exonuclease PolX [Planctomycetota bacterium]|nr:DNA polymerase/3'-5' exonuclease PolX [Planctomycetota bacterium]MDA1178929.1 DNA polymerase/3'-5' exonuclease PolX [Planctomycetota bacterium]
MDNRQVSASLNQLADLLEFQGANSFRIRAYRQAAATIAACDEQVVDRLDDPLRPLTDLPGIGKDLAQKIETLARSGNLPQLEELSKQIPLSVLDLVRVPALGPKKAAVLFRELGIDNLTDLRAACVSGSVAALKGFGAKSCEKILHGIEIAEQANQRMRLDKATHFAAELKSYMELARGAHHLEFAGSFRRGRETVGDLDLLVASTDPRLIMDHLGQFPEVGEIIARGETKMSVRMRNGLQVDLRVVAADAMGAAWQYFTGSQDHNVTLRGRAKELGLKVNEYGVFRILEAGAEERIASVTESEVYAAVGLPWIPPELRENRDEFRWADAGKLPELITLADLRGDLHMHTVATDGSGTIEQMASAARSRGWEYIAITDHSQRVSMARGLNPSRLRDQWREIDQCNQLWAGEFEILKGIECDILESGGLDLPDDVLAEADWVLASVHYGQQQSKQQITDRVLGAIEHPYVSGIAHPTGRLLGQRPPYEIDMAAVFQAAVRCGKFLELNASPKRLDLHDGHCSIAREKGIPIVINSDAHSVTGFDVLQFGIVQARRGGLTRSDVLNTRSLSELRAYLAKLRNRK